jgi:glycosyltransferase involved in cell wall biosynthesis
MNIVNNKIKARIGVDFHVFDGKFQGSRSHLLGLFSELAALCPEFQFVFFLEQIEALRAVPGFERENIQLAYMPQASSLVRLAWLLPKLRHAYRLDILHTQYVIPLLPSRGNAVTIHDVLFENYPQFFGRLFVLRSRLLMRWSARRCDLLFSVSEYSAQEIADRYALPRGSIGVLANAVDRRVFYPGKAGGEKIQARGLVSGEYILTVGRIEPRKNHAALLRAYALLTPPLPPLVIVGQRDFGYGEFEAELAKMPSTHCVHVVSDVGDDELPALYRHALVFVYPSFAEGFGMPPLEAMASGIPVITSSSTAIPEVVDDAGLLVDPQDDVMLAKALDRVLSDKVLRHKMSCQGPIQADCFSWRKSAEVLRTHYYSYLDGLRHE